MAYVLKLFQMEVSIVIGVRHLAPENVQTDHTEGQLGLQRLLDKHKPDRANAPWNVAHLPTPETGASLAEAHRKVTLSTWR